MNEFETKAGHIDPALKAAGWGVGAGSRIRRKLSNMNHKMTKPRPGMDQREISLLTEPIIFRARVFYKYVAPTTLEIRLPVTIRHQLKTGTLFTTLPITNCYRLKNPPKPRNLIAMP